MPKLSTVELTFQTPGGVSPPWYPTGFAPGVIPLSDGTVLHLPMGFMQNGAVSGIDLLPGPPYYDATSDASYVDWAAVPSGLFTRTSFLIQSTTNKDAYFQVDDTTLTCRYYWDGEVVVASFPYDPVNMRFWRLRHDGVHVHWEIASVLGAWSQVAVESILDWSSWTTVGAVTVSVAHVNIAGALVGEAQLRGFNATTPFGFGHDPMLDLILASVRRTFP